MTARRLPDPTTRRLVAQIGGNARVRQAVSPQEMTAPARAAFLARFEREVDPDGTLPPDERVTKARAALREQMARVSLARVQSSTRRRAEAAGGAGEVNRPASARPVASPAPRGAPPRSWAQFLEDRQAPTSDD
ncbi:hypothetical protein MXD61_04805 [Frankia sp. AgPm24]|uniref:hypothetical protein n=1 Tax=Frankia sp. AgPm24 TaxID=631128 RepID=UPI00200FF764|nr:hypothetical protein [Frankia sp. AgPm24]MCK9921228.1 hypothetical protein [Frankia sp. AgPm24]